jgi:hypothetical protein
MDELLARATQGVDPDSPDAFVHIFLNLLNLMPWAAMFWWSVAFVVVGAALGWFRGRTVEGIVWSAALGPIGWIVVLMKPVSRPRTGPPPLKPASPGPKPPPLKRPPLN